MLYSAVLLSLALVGLTAASPTKDRAVKARGYQSSPVSYHGYSYATPSPSSAPSAPPTTYTQTGSRPGYTETPSYSLSPMDGPSSCCASCGSDDGVPDDNRFFLSTECGTANTGFITVQPPMCDNNITCAVVEYSFITTEVPAGFFGTQFNDFFEISITANADDLPIGIGEYVSTTNSISGLDLGAFNNGSPAASTCCYSLNLNLDNCNAGLPITFGAAVANAGDNFGPSALCGTVYFLDSEGNVLYGTVVSESESTYPTCPDCNN